MGWKIRRQVFAVVVVGGEVRERGRTARWILGSSHGAFWAPPVPLAAPFGSLLSRVPAEAFSDSLPQPAPCCVPVTRKLSPKLLPGHFASQTTL